MNSPRYQNRKKAHLEMTESLEGAPLQGGNFFKRYLVVMVSENEGKNQRSHCKKGGKSSRCKLSAIPKYTPVIKEIKRVKG